MVDRIRPRRPKEPQAETKWVSPRRIGALNVPMLPQGPAKTGRHEPELERRVSKPLSVELFRLWLSGLSAVTFCNSVAKSSGKMYPSMAFFLPHAAPSVRIHPGQDTRHSRSLDRTEHAYPPAGSCIAGRRLATRIPAIVERGWHHCVSELNAPAAGPKLSRANVTGVGS